MADKQTSMKVASQASDVLQDGRTADDSKTAGGSALNQRQGGHSTSDEAASTSSDVLRDDDTSTKSKASAGSAVAQHEPDKDD